MHKPVPEIYLEIVTTLRSVVAQHDKGAVTRVTWLIQDIAATPFVTKPRADHAAGGNHLEHVAEHLVINC